MKSSTYLARAGVQCAGLCKALALAGWLSACAVGPKYQAPNSQDWLPAQFSHTSVSLPEPSVTPPLAQDWWSVFKDPGLDRLVQAALAHSPDLESAAAAVRESRAALGVSKANQGPQIDADGRVGRDQFSRDSENFANIPLPHPQTAFDDYRLGFDASWEIDVFGHTRREIERQKALLGSQVEQAHDAALRVAAETANAVLEDRYWHWRIDNAQTMLAQQVEVLRLVRLQEKAGTASLSDVRLAEASLRNTQATLPPMWAQQQLTRAALLPLTALSLTEISAILEHAPAHPVIPKQIALGLPSELLQRRADVRMAERQLAATTADVGVAVADQYPRFSLIGNAGWDSITPGKLGEQASQTWSLGPQLSLPLFHTGALKAQVRAKEAARDAALASYRKAVLQALSDVESALIRCRADTQRSDQLRHAQHAQEQELVFAKQRVAVGEVPQTELLQQQLQVESSREASWSAEQALAQDWVSLYKALGGGMDAARR